LPAVIHRSPRVAGQRYGAARISRVAGQDAPDRLSELCRLIDATNFDVALELLAAEIFLAAAPSLPAEIERIDRTKTCEGNLENGP